MGKQIAQVKLPLIKDYRATRDALFYDLSQCEHGCDEYNDIRSKIYELDEANEDHIDEGCVTAQGLNFNDIRRKFEHIPQDLGIDPHAIQDTIRGEFQHIMSEMASPVAKQVFKTSAHFADALYGRFQSLRQSKPELADAIDGVSIPISLSVINLEYDGFMRRAEGLCRLLIEQSEHWQFNRHSVKWLINNTGPDKIGINLSGELFTSVFSFSIGVNMPLALGVEIVDLALEKAGVPE